MGRTSDAREKLLSAALELIWASSFGSVSVDQICERAGVSKGSFYHFFTSKTELALAAYEEGWRREIQPFIDRTFRPEVPPLQRLSLWCDEIYAEQKRIHAETGHVPGCPFCSLAAEMATQDERLRQKAEEILERDLFHVERALRDAVRDGSIRPTDTAAKARSVSTFIFGSMLNAKVRNDPEVLRNLATQVLEFIGAPVPA